MQTKTKLTPEIIDTIDRIGIESIARSSDSQRKEGEYTPIQFDEIKEIYKGFLSDWTSDCRTRFLFNLISRGFKEVFYEAPYFWKFSNGSLQVEYVEGDIYVSTVKSN